MRNFARLLLRRFSKAGKPFDVLGRSWSRNRVAQGIGLGLIVFAASVGLAQEHAPTPAQCQADEKAWSAESRLATSGTGFDLTIRRYSLNELVLRAKEMTGCSAVDTKNLNNYSSTATIVFSQIEKRLIRYIQETGQADRYDAWEKQRQSESRLDLLVSSVYSV